MDKGSRASLSRALPNPAAVYRSPEEVAADAGLTPAERLVVLASWEEDARALAVAEEENMGGGEPSRIEDVVAARVRLQHGVGTGQAVAHKHGGVRADRSSLRVRHLSRTVRETIHADQAIDEAALRLRLQAQSVLPVTDGDEIVGLLTDADLARARQVRDQDVRLTARMTMSTELVFCYVDDDAKTAAALMDRCACDHLLVVERDRTLVGILERADLPSMAAGAVPRWQSQAEIVDPHRQRTPGIAKTLQPGRLDVYALRPWIRPPRN